MIKQPPTSGQILNKVLNTLLSAPQPHSRATVDRMRGLMWYALRLARTDEEIQVLLYVALDVLQEKVYLLYKRRVNRIKIFRQWH